MGTSADRSSGTGGAWTPLKLATNSFLRTLGRPDTGERALRVLKRHVPLLGGHQGATGSSVAGTGGAQRLGAFLAGLGQNDLDSALAAIGLGDLVGEDRFSVLDALVTFIAGDGDDLDSQAARDAACDVMDELFADADIWADLASAAVTSGELAQLIERFLALYIYNRVPVVAERLSRLTDPVAARAADQQMRQIIEDLVAIHIAGDAFTIDWQGNEGRQIIAEAIDSVYVALEATADGGQDA